MEAQVNSEDPANQWTTKLKIKFGALIALFFAIQYAPLIPSAIPYPPEYPIENASFDEGAKAYKAKNYSLALAHFIGAAEQGDARAQAMAGRMYWKGEGVSVDMCQGTFWIDQAARQGEMNSQGKMSEAIFFRYGIRGKDRDANYLWVLAAVNNPQKEYHQAWYEEVTGVRNDPNAYLESMEQFYDDPTRQGLLNRYARWDYRKQPAVRIERVRDIPIISSISFGNTTVRPCSKGPVSWK